MTGAGILETQLTAQQRRVPGAGQGLGRRALLTVINDILDFSKIEAGKLDLDPVPFDLRDCVDETLKSLALRAHAKGLELSGRIAPETPDHVVGDSGRLRQILVNLVGNAIKFTDRGEVVVSVEASPAAEAGEDVTLHVSAPGHRHWYPGRQDPGHLRALHPGRRLHHAQVRRDGSGVGHLLQARGADGRTALGRERARPGQHVPFHRPVRPPGPRGQGPGEGRADPEQLRDSCRSSWWTTTTRTAASSTRS